MANLMGDDAGTCLQRPGVAAALGIPGVALHLYGKGQARPGRKMGHLTALGEGVEEAMQRALAARQRIVAPG
jgi:5-(carboxyamino)imidazole ribonucleotide synthase